jgi:spore germination cell wall hydrolase CwlJ-like protein
MEEKQVNILVNWLIAFLVVAAILVTVSRINLYVMKNKVETYALALPAAQEADRTSPLRREAICLAQNIYHEARNQSLRGQLAVASVTMNRVYAKRFPDTVCGVVYQQNKRGCQFTWICKHRWVDVNTPKFNEKYRLAVRILTGEIELESLDNAVYYHANYVRPWWAKYKSFVEQIGAHKFYREKQA